MAEEPKWTAWKAYIDEKLLENKLSMREEQDIHSGFTWEKFLREGVDAHFNARTRALDAPYTEALAITSDYWTQDSYAPPFAGYVTCPTTVRAIAIYSKQVYNYPYIATQVILPDLSTLPSWAGLWWGLVNGSDAGNGGASFKLVKDAAGVIHFYAQLGSFLHPGRQTWTQVEIKNLLPADYTTARHIYSVELTNPMAIYYIDEIPVAYGLFTPGTSFPAILGPPYALFSINGQIAKSLEASVEVQGSRSQLRVELPPYGFRVSDGDPRPPRVYRLYDAGTNTLFTSLVITVGSETSHPFPIFGYEGKTINFRASEQGTLSVETYMQTGNWREYDTMGITTDKLRTYSIEDDGVIARVVFTPNSYPCTIGEAEVYLK